MCGGSKGQSTTNSVSNYAPSAAGASAITGALSQAQNAAATPFSAPAAPVAGFSPDQLAAFQGVNNAQGQAQPYYNQASNLFNQSAAGPNINQFLNPYASAVTSQLNNVFGQQASQNTGQLTQAAGGVGADRIAVGQGELANQQGLAAGQTLAGLYAPSLSAAQQQQSLLQSAGYGQASLGTQAENEALTGAQAQLGTGGLQQQLSQAQLNSPYQQQIAALAYPFQTSQFLSSAVGALAPGLGGTTSGTSNTTPAAPSIWSQLLGAGALGAGVYGGLNGSGSTGKGASSQSPTGAFNAGMSQNTLANNSGGAYYGPGFARGGSLPGFAGGGSESSSPYSLPSGFNDNPINIDTESIVPQSQITPIHAQQPQINLNPPSSSGNSSSGLQQAVSIGSTLGKAAMMFMNRGGAANPFAEGGGVRSPFHPVPIITPPVGNDNQPARFSGKGPAGANDNGEGEPPRRYASGGSMNPYFADGGDATMADRFDPVIAAIKNGDFDPQGADSTTFQGTPGMAASNSGSVPMPRARPRQSMADSPDGPALSFAGPDTSTSLPPEITGPVANAYAAMPPGTSPAPDAAPSSNMAQDFIKSPWAALAAAGLGIMGGSSPYAGINIGQGGAQGIKMLEEQRSAGQKDETIKQAADRLKQEAKFHEDQFSRMTMGQKIQKEEADRPYHELTAAQKEASERQDRLDELAEKKFDRPYNELTKAEQAQLEETRRQHDMSRTPVGMKRDENGNLVAETGGPHDPETIRREADAKRLPAMSREDMSPLVDAYMTGDRSVMTGIGRGTQGPANIQQMWGMIAERLHAQGADGKTLAAAKADFTAQSQAAGVAAKREASITTAVNEAKATFPQVEATSKALPRTDYPLINSAVQSFRTNTGSPQQRAFGAAIQAAITAYSQAMSRTGANSVYAQQHAEAILNKTDGHEALMATLKQLDTEMEIAKAAPAETRKDILNHILGVTDATGTGQPAAGATAAPALPPEAAKALREGQVTTFGNGQKWTLKNGQPAQVP